MLTTKNKLKLCKQTSFCGLPSAQMTNYLAVEPGIGLKTLRYCDVSKA